MGEYIHRWHFTHIGVSFVLGVHTCHIFSFVLRLGDFFFSGGLICRPVCLADFFLLGVRIICGDSQVGT